MGDLARGVELLGNRGTDREKENLPSCRLEASGQNNKQVLDYIQTTTTKLIQDGQNYCHIHLKLLLRRSN